MLVGRALALKLFEAFSIQRWTDVIRPIDLVEMDKAAEKMVIAYLLGKYEEERGNSVEWNAIIYGGLFDLLVSTVLSDIKAPVRELIQEEAPDEFEQLKTWVIEQYDYLIGDERLLQRFAEYVRRKGKTSDLSSRILAAAHHYATYREFQLVKPVNPPTARLIREEERLVGRLRSFLDLDGLQRLLTMQKPYQFVTIVEQLRYQVRWSQTPRVPPTSVLGHSYYVAVLALLLLRQHEPCPKREYNVFFGALFHDLPETVTRDIVSPVKSATKTFPHVVKRVEERVVQQELVPTMDDCFRDELLYFTADEFTNRVKRNGCECRVSFEDLDSRYNKDEYDPIDGELVRVADHMAAFVEAERSISNGVSSEHLKEGKDRIKSLYLRSEAVSGINVWEFYNQF